MDIPLDETIHFDCITTHPSTGAATDADSTPTFAVYEEATDTDIGVGGNLTKRTSLTGNYRGTFTLSAANGFEIGKWYSIIGSATVNSIAGKAVLKNFRVVAAEAIVGKPKADVDAFRGTASVGAAGYVDLSATGLDAISVTAPSGVATTFPGMVVQLWRRFFKKATKTSTSIVTYANDGSTPVTTQTISDSSGTQTQGAAS